VDDRQHGQGKYHWPNGQFYDGEWRSSQFQVRLLLLLLLLLLLPVLVLFWENHCNAPQGRGTFTYPNGLRVTGQWEAGRLVLKN